MADPQAQTAFADENLPGSFYLGREYDLAKRSVLDQRIDYESKDLVTHGVVVGMTGSGKTGLCISLLEEAAIDGIPCIMIDPKGDLSNLLLQFPNLAPEDFLPWLNPDEAKQRDLPLDGYAKQVAERWKQGLLETGQTAERIRQLRARSEYRIYTPGSEAGLPLSLLKNFTAPGDNLFLEDLNQKIDATASALLGLTGISADPVQSKEHIFIANLLKFAWTGTPPRDLDLPTLIEWIQTPPIEKVGVLELDKFYKEKDRMKLAVALNNVLAAPSFETWQKGDPLDLSTLLAKTPGKAQQLIFSVAHLDDAQRMFFITLLLAEVLAWTRKQKGTTSLRAIVYFDEVFGYLPPHPGNPPTKPPLMTLLKQARAFGVGIVLATQNPVDIDYKALSNAGTWFVGKLQTGRDKERLLDGLEGVAAEWGARSNRADLEKTIGSLSNRVFLLHNIHRGGEAKVFQTRWALSYLRGPMTREDIKELMDKFRQGQEPDPAVTHDPVPAPPAPVAPPSVPSAAELAAVASHSPPAPAAPPTPAVQAAPVPVASVAPAPSVPPTPPPPAATPLPVATAAPAPLTSAAPLVLPAEMPQFFLPVKQTNPGGATLVYQCMLLGFADVIAEDKKMGRKYTRPFRLLAPAPPDGRPADWKTAEAIPEGLDAQPRAGANFGEVPASLNAPKKVEALKKAFGDYLAGAKLTMPSCPKLNMSPREGEDLAAFQARVRAEVWKEFEKRLAAEKEPYVGEFARYKVAVPEAPPVDSLVPWDDRWHTFLAGSPVLRAAAPADLTAKQKQQLEQLEKEWHGVKTNLAEQWKRVGDQLGELVLAVKKGDVKVLRFGLAWTPFWQLPGTADLVPAYR